VLLVTARPLLGLAALVLAACARTGAPDASANAVAGSQTVGYVHMEELVKVHPLYGQLARYDQNIQALNLSTIVPKTLAAAPELARREAELQKQLEDAAKRTDALLAEKSKEYQQRESQAIDAALKGTNGGAGTSVGAVQSQVQQTANGQAATVAKQAQRDLDAYRKALEAEDAAQTDALQKTLVARADRTYRAKVDELNAKDAALSLKLATDDSAERLSLRTKLASLALDDGSRQDAKARLDALDKTEAEALAAQRAQDQQTLAALQTQLRNGVQNDLRAQVAPIHARSQARFLAREAQLRTQFSAPAGPLIAANGKNGAVVNPNLPPALREKIAHLHDDYAKAFQHDAGATIADFKKTREMLKKRYDALTGMNDEAARDVAGEIASLQRKREELYDQMVAQIGREVQTVARAHGVSVVVSDVAAAAGGIDLTADAKKDIETLHE
jgi:hypothetical protein